MKGLVGILLLLPLAALGLVEDGPPPTTRTATCTDNGCHAEVTPFRYLHGPVAAGACESCHLYADETRHLFDLKAEGAAMCDFCHLGKSDTAGLRMHEPVEKGQCLECHHPHGSNVRRLLRSSSQGALCQKCHEDTLKDITHLHTPVAEGDCSSCHRPHSSVHPKLLVEEGRRLCVTCHDPPQWPHAPLPSLTRVSLLYQPAAILERMAAVAIHEPYTGECSQCHDSHGSAFPAGLKDAPGALCRSCHEAVSETASAAVVQHSMMNDERSCLACHMPHTAGVPKLLRDKPVRLCLTCHHEAVTRGDGSMVASVGEMAETGVTLHGPAAEGTCRGCHLVHGGAERNLLTVGYDVEFYQEYTPGTYAFCFQCHEAPLVTTDRTADATDFRNGEVNLHAVHVRDPENAGRSCRACHRTHASHSDRLLYRAVAYGQWNIPIGFEPTATGGSCVGGCHRARTYDRQRPVVYVQDVQ